MPQVLNRGRMSWKTFSNLKNAVYVGRPGLWGNPYVVGKDGTREEVIEKYKKYFWDTQVLYNKLHQLRGKDLVCWCAPQACHADFLLQITKEKYMEDK